MSVCVVVAVCVRVPIALHEVGRGASLTLLALVAPSQVRGPPLVDAMRERATHLASGGGRSRSLGAPRTSAEAAGVRIEELAHKVAGAAAPCERRDTRGRVAALVEETIRKLYVGL